MDEDEDEDTNIRAHPLLAALGQNHDDASLASAACAAHALHQADGAFLSVEAYNEVHLSDI